MKKLSLLFSFSLLLSSLIAQTAGESIDVTHYAIHVNELNFGTLPTIRCKGRPLLTLRLLLRFLKLFWN